MSRSRASAKQAGSSFAKSCLRCGASLPTDSPGRGGKQPTRKFCSTTCKDAQKNAERDRPAGVKCNQCGNVRILKHPHLAGATCVKCSSRKGSEAAARLCVTGATDRFMRQVSVNDASGCWEWTGCLQPNGYSLFGADDKQHRGHRWSYENFIGPIPEGLVIDHLCRNRKCVNPKHLEPVTQAENMRRIRKTHCVNGHARTDDNIYTYAGKRHCRACRRDRSRAAWRAKHGAVSDR